MRWGEEQQGIESAPEIRKKRREKKGTENIRSPNPRLMSGSHFSFILQPFITVSSSVRSVGNVCRHYHLDVEKFGVQPTNDSDVSGG